tara:strand:- start:2761 stop:3231 length:471 start_codon:yes stop_codon:yes gene_type:complete
MNQLKLTKEQKLKKGISFESYIADWFQREKGISLSTYHAHNEQRKGENRQGIEIKNDQCFNSTGNLFISVKRIYGTLHLNWGVFKQDNTWLYVIGDKSKHWIFLRKTLQTYYKVKQPKLKKAAIKGGTELGFLLTLKQADKLGDCYKAQTQINYTY